MASSTRVIVTWPGFPGSAGAALLDEAGQAYEMSPRVGERTAAEVAAAVGDAVAVIASTDLFDAHVFDACPALAIVARVGVGFDAIDVGAATAAGVAITTTPGTNSSSVADHALALMLALIRKVAAQDAAIRRGDWPRDTSDIAGELTGRTVGLVGYGAIGRLVAQRLQGFGCEVLAHDPAYAGGDLAEAVPLADLLVRSSVVSLHAPLLPATRHVIGAAELAAMPPGAILVNTARGGLVDEDALVAALAGGTLGGAALDVYAEEPPPVERFRDFAHVVLTPHLAGLSDRSRDAMTRAAAASVLDALAGRAPGGLLNPDVLQNPRSPIRAAR